MTLAVFAVDLCADVGVPAALGRRRAAFAAPREEDDHEHPEDDRYSTHGGFIGADGAGLQRLRELFDGVLVLAAQRRRSGTHDDDARGSGLLRHEVEHVQRLRAAVEGVADASPDPE